MCKGKSGTSTKFTQFLISSFQDISQGMSNISRTLEVCNRLNIPVYSGAVEPLIYPFPKLDPGFLALECGNSLPFLTQKRKSVEANEEHLRQHAAIHLINAAKELDGELSLVSLGPLTNIAIAVSLDPYFASRISKYIAVGGCEGRGDATATAEFNFFVDPEAARLVFCKFTNITLITRALAQKYVWNMEEEWLEKAKTAKARFLENILQVYEEMNGKMDWTGSGPLAAAIVAWPDIVISSKTASCHIECHGELTRGQSVFQFDQQTVDGNVVDIITEMDEIQFHQVLENIII
eukprot:g5995.t1